MIAVVDIDGVLADATHRQHHVQRRPKDWDAFFAAVGDDPLLPQAAGLLDELSELDVVLLSGRPERTRADTEAWLAQHGIEVTRLVLRADADHRPADIVKADLIGGIGSPAEVAVVVDDDERVLARLSALGYRTRYAG